MVWIDERGSEVLDVAECRRLLAVGARDHRHGHLGIGKEGAPIILPVNYVVFGPDVVVRVGEGLFPQIEGALVAFEVDGLELLDRGERRAWSVLVRGLAREVSLADVGAHLPVPEVAEAGRRLVRIRADRVSGRRLVAPPPARRGCPPEPR